MNRLHFLATGLLTLPLLLGFFGHMSVTFGIEDLAEKAASHEGRISAMTVDAAQLDALTRNLELQRKELAKLRDMTRQNAVLLEKYAQKDRGKRPAFSRAIRELEESTSFAGSETGLAPIEVRAHRDEGLAGTISAAQ